MSRVGLGLGYWLPRTEFTVGVTQRSIVATGPSGSHLEPVVDVQVTAAAVEDPGSRQALFIDSGLLERVALTVNLDDRGFIQSVNGESGRDLAAVMSVIGKAVGLAAVFLAAAKPTTKKSLDVLWAEANPQLAQRRDDLQARIGTLLEALGAPATELTSVPAVGAALDVLQSQLASISEVRRTWIASHARTVAAESWRVGPTDLLLIKEPVLPTQLNKPQVPPALKKMSDEFGVLVAIVDSSRAATPTQALPEASQHVDAIALRRSRPAVVGIYVRDPDKVWTLDPASVKHLDVVDEMSPTDYLPLDGSWWHTRKFELSYHPDMSLKTFGLTTSSSASAAASSFGDVLDAVGAARKQIAERPTASDEALETAKTQLDLLKATSEYEALSATRGRSAELAVLEQLKKIRTAQD